MRILVSGKNSQMGKKLFSFAKDLEYEFIFLDSKDMNLKDPSNIKKVINTYKPEIIINFSAYTNVDASEDNFKEAEIVNSLGPKYLSEASNISDAFFIQISTDYVFGNFGSAPYSSFDKTGPINLYGVSKQNGEKYSLEGSKKSLIIRTSSLYSEYGNNFVKTISDKLIKKEDIKVVSDQMMSMTFADDFIRSLLVILKKDKLEYLISSLPLPILHYTNEGFTTWFDVANEILDNLNEYYSDLGTIAPIPYSKWPAKALRPKDSRLLIDYGLLNSLNIKLYPWKPRIKEVIQKLVNEKRN